MKIYLIDSNSYIYRFYHALSGLSSSRGFPTNAIYGFTGMLIKLTKDLEADGIAAAFDLPYPTERHSIYSDYKANRPEMPQDLVVQMPVIKQIIRGFNIKIFESPGYEADDLIGSIAKRLSSEGKEVFILSGDKDMMQLVTERVKIYDYMKDSLIDEKQVIERFGVPPERVPDIMALAGDSSDNIPGVKGIGEKKARELIRDAGSVEALIDNCHQIKNQRIRTLISDNTDIINISKRLALINTEAPINESIEDIVYIKPDWDELRRIFMEYDLRAYLKLVPSEVASSTVRFSIINSEESLRSFLYAKNKSQSERAI